MDGWNTLTNENTKKGGKTVFRVFEVQKKRKRKERKLRICDII
jgi:hypothetical protein